MTWLKRYSILVCDWKVCELRAAASRLSRMRWLNEHILSVSVEPFSHFLDLLRTSSTNALSVFNPYRYLPHASIVLSHSRLAILILGSSCTCCEGCHGNASTGHTQHAYVQQKRSQTAEGGSISTEFGWMVYHFCPVVEVSSTLTVLV